MLVTETSEELDAVIVENPLLVVFYAADWSGPSKEIAPAFATQCADNPGVAFAKANIDKVGKSPAAAKVTGVPQFHFYKDGQLVNEFFGADASKLKKCVAELISS